MQSLRIYQYIRQFPFEPRKRNEMASAVAGLAGGLARSDIETVVLCESRQNATYRADEGYTIRSFPNPDEKPSKRLSPELIEFIKTQGKGSLTVLNGMFCPSLWAMADLLRQCRLPFVVAPHGPHHPLVFQDRPLTRWMQFRFREKMMLRKAVGLQLPDENCKPLLRARGVKTRVFQVPVGYDKRDVPPDASLVFRDTPSPVKLLQITDANAQYRGADVLAAAVAKINDVTLTLARTEGDDAQLKPLLNARVRLTNFADHPLWELLGAHDVVCVPSRVDGFGVWALHAMLSARPVVVSSDLGIAPHVAAAKCGVLVQPTADGVVAGLAELLRRRGEFREMGLRGRQYAIKRLDWDQIAKSVVIDYQTLPK